MNDSLTRYRPYLAMTVLFLIVLAGTIYFLRRPEPIALTIVTPTPRSTATPALIKVDVRGAVSRPGVYTLPVGSRVQDVLALAGDLWDTAEMGSINLAQILIDGEQIYVPTIGEPMPAPPQAASKGGQSNTAPRIPSRQININTATVEELDTLPGVGPVIAQRIVDYRVQNGPFRAIEDLNKVRGIGDVLFDQIKAYITIQ